MAPKKNNSSSDPNQNGPKSKDGYFPFATHTPYRTTVPQEDNPLYRDPELVPDPTFRDSEHLANCFFDRQVDRLQQFVKENPKSGVPPHISFSFQVPNEDPHHVFGTMIFLPTTEMKWILHRKGYHNTDRHVEDIPTVDGSTSEERRASIEEVATALHRVRPVCSVFTSEAWAYPQSGPTPVRDINNRQDIILITGVYCPKGSKTPIVIFDQIARDPTVNVKRNLVDPLPTEANNHLIWPIIEITAPFAPGPLHLVDPKPGIAWLNEILIAHGSGALLSVDALNESEDSSPF